MNEDRLDPELEKLLKQVKLKEPRKEELNDYLKNVHSKIEQMRPSGFGLPLIGIGVCFAVGLLGVMVFLNFPSGHVVSTPAVQTVQTLEKKVSIQKKELTLEEQIQVLEAFSEEANIDISEVFGEDEAAEDLLVLDEMELSSLGSSLSAH